MVKRIGLLLLCAAMAMVLASCNLRQRAASAVQDRIMEKALGDNVEIDSNKEQVKIKGEDGEEIIFGADQWPDGKAARMVPEFKDGKVASVMSSDNYCLIVVEGSSEKEWQSYVGKLKAEGFDRSAMEYSDDNSKIYQGFTEDGHMAMASVDREGNVSISVQVSTD